MAVEQAWSVRISHWEPLRLVLTGLSCLGWDVKKSYPVAMFRCHKNAASGVLRERGGALGQWSRNFCMDNCGDERLATLANH